MSKTDNNRIMRMTLSLVITVIAASSLCLFLYHNDNKYTAPGAQPIAGTLFISETDMTQTLRRYLWNGWYFYPDVMLTPETYDERPSEKSVSVRIGSYNNFAFGNSRKSTHGCGTYVLTLQLPETPHTYAVELPVIYSSFKFYTGNDLALSMGDTDGEKSSGVLQDRLVTFEASGTVRLMLAVRDDTGIYSGMIYPPAFGELLAVNTARAVRFMLSVAAVITSFLFSLLALWLALRNRHDSRTLRLFCMLCLSTAFFVAYPALHSILSLPVQPWQTAELTNGYILTSLIISLHNILCGVPRPARKLSEAICIIMCIIALLYSAGAASLTQPFVAGFSALTFIFRAGTAAYLLMITVVFYRNIRFDASMLLYAVVFYAVVFIWSCILPDYEPVMSSWFQEWGSMVLTAALGITLWLDVVRKYRLSLTAGEELRQMKRQLEIQQAHYSQIAEHVEQSRRQRHDFRQHLRAIASLSGDSAEQLKYIQKIADVNISQRMESYCHDKAVDALLYYYVTAAKKDGVNMTVKIEIPENITLPAVQLCTIAGNLLENALEACQRQTSATADRYISIHMKWQFSKLYLVTENSFDGDIRCQRDSFISLKHDGLGTGTESVRSIAKQLGGTVEFRVEKERFTAIVIVGLN